MGSTTLTIRGSNLERFTDRERRFVFEYLIDLNGTRAAIAAGYSKKTAGVMATQLLKKPHIRKYIGKQERLKAEQALVKRGDLIQELVYQSFRDVIDLCDPETGQIVLDDLRKLPENIRKCIDGIKVKTKTIETEQGEMTEQTIELKLVSKTNSQDMLMKHFGWYAKDGQGSSDNNGVKRDWDALAKPQEIPDIVEERLNKLEQGDGR